MYGFRVMIEGDYACFTKPEHKVERVSSDVPTPGALEGLLKSVYWKPAIRYVIDRIVVFNPIRFANVRRNEVKDKILYSKVRAKMNGKVADPCIYTSDNETRSQRSAIVLKNVRYGVEFHFELTGICCEDEENSAEKHSEIIRRRLEKGQFFRNPCLGCCEFPVGKLYPVEQLDLSLISEENIARGDVDLGMMLYRMQFKDGGKPKSEIWNKADFSDSADALYYRPHMINGVIDVAKYREGIKC